jgi:hypothetical protein
VGKVLRVQIGDEQLGSGGAQPLVQQRGSAAEILAQHPHEIFFIRDLHAQRRKRFAPDRR